MTTARIRIREDFPEAPLCPHCGKNLNDGPCDCVNEDLDPRLASLRDMLDERRDLMQLCKDSLTEAARQFRTKYEMAGKAREVLENSRDILRQYFDPEELLTALASLDPVPPRRLPSSRRQD